MTNDAVYDVLQKVYLQLSNLFDDEHMHVGGDEVTQGCLNEVQDELIAWLNDHHIPADSGNFSAVLVHYFRTKMMEKLATNPSQKKLIVWEEAFLDLQGIPNSPLNPNNTIVQLWDADYVTTMNAVLQAGYQALTANAFYIDRQVLSLTGQTHYLYIDTFQDMYPFDLKQNLTATEEQLKLILGAEVP